MAALSGSDTCDCTTTQPVTASPKNGPGLDALSYRVGTYGAFLRRMLDQLPLQTVPPEDPAATARPLAALRTRVASDPTVALLDAWAVSLDVFTFYQERIANEGFLRTASERRSVLELGRATGYELDPGVAATTYLAFTIENTPSSGGRAAIPRGTQVQSLPSPAQTPQPFETLADFAARASWNELRPRTKQRQRLRLSNASPPVLLAANDEPCSYLYLAGTTLGLRSGDLLLFVAPSTVPSAVKTLPRFIHSVAVDIAAGYTRVNLEPSTPDEIPLFSESANAPGVVTLSPTPLTHDYVEQNIVKRSWHEADLRALIGFQRWDENELLKYVERIVAEEPDTLEVHVLRQRVGFFGNSAPLYASLRRAGTAPGEEDYPYDGSSYNWDGLNPPPPDPVVPPKSIWQHSSSAVYFSTDSGADVFLERTLPEIVREGWVVFRSPSGLSTYVVRGASERALAEYASHGKATGLLLGKPQSPESALANNGTDKPADLVFRTTTAFVQSERLNLALLPIGAPTDSGTGALTLDGMVLGLVRGQPVWVRGELAGVPGVVQDEVVLLDDVIHDRGYTTLGFSTGLRRSYRRSSITINANVVSSSHGETAPPEVLGNGDATQQNQRFVLKRPGVTYLSVPTASGIQSTVTVTVNGVPWKEVSSLYEVDGRSESFMLRTDDDGITTVIFGDGEHGARLPTGRENVVATYRTCDASTGAVDAGRLTLLKTRPLGVRGVTNPLSAVGNSAPESLTQGRANASLATQLIDRIVTLQDYQSFTSAFPGIGKAYARALWDGRGRIVHITVSGEGGSAVPADSALQANLLRSIFASSDPSQSVQVASYQPRYFAIAADLVLAPQAASAQVLDDARAALLSAFAFERRGFAQPVTAAEIAKVLQAVPGVAATILRRLARLDEPPSAGLSPSQLAARDTYFDADATPPRAQPAELLLLAASDITLTEIAA